MYTYLYPHPAVTTDAVVFTIRDDALQVLLIERGCEPSKGMLAFPGGFVDIDEHIDDCVRRELAEETGLSGIELQQFHTFGAPGRDPRERIITVAYMALVPSAGIELRPGDDAARVDWYPAHSLPPLAADHTDMAERALAHLAERLEMSDIALNLVPEEFRLEELQRVYEIILGDTLQPDAFRDWVLSKGWIEKKAD
ncbi:MAG: NUDIX hydrolase [Gammaproteobacteria bacterium]|jgi:8-oxo-dGTP diphosphatase|nr:NUDIX hydrolase [Gammaproteobacteria bacterium]